MDGNKEEALKCLKIAKNSIQSGDKDRALKFPNKARRLDPSIEIDEFLSNFNASPPEEKSPDQPTDEKPPDSSESGSRRRVPTTSSSSTTYPEEQVTLVREIRRKKDYYEILGLEKNCTDEDVKKAYRKFSLKVHPDKNKAPGAEEAFKIVSKAFQCLSDEESRKKYDVLGSDEPVYERRGGDRNGMRGFNGFYEGDIDADEIFRKFFFGGMHPATTGNCGGFTFGPGGAGVRVRTGGVDHTPNWLRTCIQLLPVILIVLVNFLPSPEPVYSSSRTHYHDARFTTPKGVNYYVNSGKFEQEYPVNSAARVALEHRVEDDYHTGLVENCRIERQQLQWGYRRETPNCDPLRSFDAMAG